LFEQAHKQKDFLENMFEKLLHEQRDELRQFFGRQAQQLEETRHMQKQFFEEVMYRIDRLEAETAAKLYAIERHMQAQPSLPPSTPEPKEGAV
jgi:hypothetical protein